MADATAAEGAPLIFTLTRAGDTTGASALTYTTVADTTADAKQATAGADYTAVGAAQTLSFAAGDTEKTLRVATAADALVEGAETLRLALADVSGATLANTYAIGTITEGTTGYAIANASASEGDSLTFTVTRSGAVAGASTVTWTTGDDPAKGAKQATAGGDYTAVSAARTLSFAADDTSKTLTVATTEDTLDEPAETFVVTLASPSAGGALLTATAIGTITDDDAATATVSVADATAVAEGDDPETTADMTFTVSLSAVSGQTVTVPFTLSGSAAAGADYTAPDPLSVTIAPGARSAAIEVPIKGDLLDEDNETVIVTLSAPTHAALSAVEGATEASGTITDDDDAPSAITLTVDADTAAEDTQTAVTENGGAKTVRVTATITSATRFDTAEDLTVVVGKGADTATETGAGADYAAVADLTLAIAAGATSGFVEFTLTPTDDAVDEADESITIAGTLAGVTVTQATVTIEDNDAAPTLAIDSPSVAEGDNTAATLTFTVSLSPASGKTVTVSYADRLTGTATSGVDYTALTAGTLTFNPGDTSKTIGVTVTGDTTDETDETVVLRLSSATNATLTGGAATLDATGTIEDNDAAPTLAIDNPSVAEGDNTAATLTFTVSLSPASGKTVTVSYADRLTGTATSGVDYTALTAGTLTFNPGDTSKTIGVTVTGDTTDETDETVVLRLSSATNATLTGGAATLDATGTIEDNDAAPTLAIDSPSVAEGDNTAATLTFTVSLSPASGKTVTVSYADRLTGTATSGVDYTALTAGTLTFNPGDTSKTIGVTVTGDTTDETDETVVLRLSSATNATLTGGVATLDATGTIEDDDAATLAIADAEAAEGATASFAVTLSTPSSRAVTVTATTSSGAADTATADADYTVKSQALTFAAGATAADFEVAILTDSLNELAETFTVTLSAPTGATLADATAIGTITDDDAATATVSVADATAVAEGDDPETTADMTFTVSLSAVSGQTVTVPFTLSGSAAAGADYTAPDPLSVTIAPGARSAAIEVPIKGDLLDEDNETVIVTLSAPTHAALSAVEGATEASGTITDDDDAPSAITLTVDADTAAEDTQTAVTENGGAKTVRVTATITSATRFDTAEDLTVVVGKGADTATETGAGADYAAVADLTLAIAAGATSGFVEFTLTPTDDAVDEADESITIAGTLAGVTVTQATVTIEDNDAAPTLAIDSPSVAEGDNTAATLTFTVSLSPASGKTVTVSYADRLTGTATSGVDYTALTAGTLTFNPGDTSKTIGVTVTGDTTDETDETVVLRLSSATNATLTGGVATLDATGTIEDDDDAPTSVMRIEDAKTVTELDDSNQITDMTFAVSITPPNGHAVTIPFTLSGTATGGVDYIYPNPLSVTIPKGQSSGVITVPIIGDVIDEKNETVIVTLDHADTSSAQVKGVVGGGERELHEAARRPGGEGEGQVRDRGVVGARAGLGGGEVFGGVEARRANAGLSTQNTDTPVARYTAIGIIADNDPTPVTSITIAIADAEGLEGTYIEFPVTLSRPSPGNVEVKWSSMAEIASFRDIAFVEGRLHFAEGEQEKIIKVWAYEDDVYDPNEVFTVRLQQPVGAVFKNPVTFIPEMHRHEKLIPAGREIALATGTIIDPVPAPSPLELSISVQDTLVDEGGWAQVEVTASAPNEFNRQIRVPLVYSNGTAEDGDYEVQTGLWLEPGRASAARFITIFHDDDTDDETLTISLGEPRPQEARIGSPSSVDLTIRDDGGAGNYPDLDLAISVDVDTGTDGIQDSVAEDGGARTVRVTATLEGATRFAEEKRVRLTVGNGTDSATEGTDYAEVADQTIIVAAGAASGFVDFTLTPTDDTLAEMDETITIEGVLPNITTAHAAIRIDDDDEAKIALTLAVDADTGTDGIQDSVAEDGGARTVRVTATLEGATRFAEEKRVAVTVGNGADGATEGTDYAQVADQTIIIAAGAASGHADFTLTPTDDALAEMDETITIEGALPNITTAHATIRIADDDEAKMALTLAVDTDTGTDGLQSEIAEGDGETLVQVTARMTGSDRFQTDRTLMVRVGVTGDSAAEGIDYAALDDFPITVEAGDASGTGTFRITPVDDKMAEGAETVTVEGRLTGASVGSTWLTIADNDEAPNGIVLSVSPASVGEDNRQTAVTVTATVSGSATYPEDTEVTVTVGSGTATAGADFSPVEDFSITIAGGASSGSGNFALSPIDDDDSEGDETVAVTGVTGDIEVTATVVTIQDDEAPVRQLVLSASDVAVDEGASASWTVRLSAVPDGPVAVTISGHEGTDLSLDSARLEFDEANWSSAQSITATAGEDDDAADDTATLAHAASGGGYDSATASLRVVTDDNDTAAIVLAPDSLDLVEGRSRSYTVTLATEPSDDVGVTVSGHTGAYLRLDRSDLMFTPSDWNIPQSITVTAQDDGTDGDARREVITLTHTGSGGGYNGTVAQLGIDVLLNPITISIEDAEGPEGSYLKFLVTLSHPSPGDVEVSWATHPDVAKSGYDFPLISGRLHFAEGEQKKVISVWAEEDELDDPNETFTVDLWRPSGAVLDDPVTVVPRYHHFDLTTETSVEIIQATGTIIGSAPDPLVLSIAASEPFVEEGGTTRVRVTANVPNELERAIRVPLVYSNGTAEDGDYEGEPGLWINTGRTHGSADITIFHDEDTDDETFTVSIGELRPLEAVVGDDDSFDLTILDDDVTGHFEGLTVSVEDATANEGEENLRFVVWLSGPAPGPVTVWAETLAGTASVNKDYHDASGEVRFARGERMLTFTVWVLDDDIDEGNETLTLQLSDPDPAEVTIARATATGTIRNSDPIPGVWLARFGRTLAQQTVDSVSDRLQARREPGLEGSAPMFGFSSGPGPSGEFRMTGARGQAGGGTASPPYGIGPSTAHGTPGGDSPGSAYPCNANGSGSLPLGTPQFSSFGTDSPRAGSGSGLAQDGGGRCGERPSIGEFLLQALSGASFTRTVEADPGGGTIAWWGRGATSQFSGSDGGLGLGGEIATGRLGVDYVRGDWLAGLTLAHSAGKGDWSGGATGSGELEASLTSISPYAAISISDRLQMWSTVGAGRGTLKLAHGNGDEWTERLKTDLEWRMAAAGAMGGLIGATDETGPELSLVTDALWSDTSSGPSEGLAASQSAVTRLRVGLEGSWTLALNEEARLTPKVEVGARHDGGDAETGFGVDLGGGIAWTDPKRGISLDIAGRTLIAHDDGGTRDWGVSAAFVYRANPDSEKGLALKLGQDLGGQSSGGLAALFAPDPPGHRFGASGGRWTSELSYGFPTFAERFMATPRVSYGFSGTERDYSLGWSLAPTEHSLDLSLDILTTWRESGGAPPEHGFRIEANARW